MFQLVPCSKWGTNISRDMPSPFANALVIPLLETIAAIFVDLLFYSLFSFFLSRVNLYVEDHKQNVGPIRISVCHEWRIGELRAKIERDFGFPSDVQKWIIGKSLIEDNSRTLYELGVKKNGAKIFLIIAPQGTTLAVFS